MTPYYLDINGEKVVDNNNGKSTPSDEDAEDRESRESRVKQ